MAWCGNSIVIIKLTVTKCAGPIPTEIGNCVALKVLDLHSTHLHDFP